MNDAVGDYDFGSGIGEREPQIIADGSGPPVALYRESEGYAAAIEADAANSAPGEKSEDTSWTAADIQHQRFGAEALDQVHQWTRHDATDFLGRIGGNPVEWVLIVECLLSCRHFAILKLARSRFPSARRGGPSRVAPRRPDSPAAIFDTKNGPKSGSGWLPSMAPFPAQSPSPRGRPPENECRKHP